MGSTLPVTLISLVTSAGLCVGIGSHETVKVVAGHDAILPCHLDPPFSMKGLTVKWTCGVKKVHLYRSGADDVDNQDKDFRNRTSLFHDEMVRGNFSLNLTNVTEGDAGNYTCYVRFRNGSEKEERRYNVTLIVDTEPKAKPESKRSDENPIGNGIGGIIFVVLVIVGVIGAAIAVVKWKQRRNNKPEEKTDKKSTTGKRWRRGRKRRSNHKNNHKNNPSDNMQSTTDTSN